MEHSSKGTTPRICIIGAGLSGLCTAIQLKRKLNLETFTIYEACAEVGGTWNVNTYPGLYCDVPSHLYSFSFAPKFDWSHMYSSQNEILEYTKDVTSRFGIYPFIQFHSRVQCLRWDAENHKWQATILNLRTNRVQKEEYDIVVNSTGKLRIPHYPPEYLNFEGTLVHSADWNSSVSITGKRVGVIGTGASAAQIIIATAPEVEHLTVFQRKAPHIIPRLQFELPVAVKWAFVNIPGMLKLTRYSIFLFHEFLYGMSRHDSFMNKTIEKVCRWYRNSQLKDPILREKTTPNFMVGCKRLVISESYYSTLARSNVDLVTDKIDKVEGHLVKTDNGEEHQLDMLILATGYQPHDFFAPMKVYGREGVDVLDEWKKDRPRGYLGISYKEMPNFFTILGPYTIVGHNSNMFNIECQVDWTIAAIKMMIEKKVSSISITREAVDGFMNLIDEQMKGSVWIKGNCDPWYLDQKGDNTTLWPFSQMEFWRMCKKLEETMFEFSLI